MEITENELDLVRRQGRAEGRAEALEHLASKLRKQSGQAFADGNDEAANSLRTRAEEIGKSASSKRDYAERMTSEVDAVYAAVQGGKDGDTAEVEAEANSGGESEATGIPVSDQADQHTAGDPFANNGAYQANGQAPHAQDLAQA